MYDIHLLHEDCALATSPVKRMDREKKGTTRCLHALVKITEVLFEHQKLLKNRIKAAG